jgi:hypothetical protein
MDGWLNLVNEELLFAGFFVLLLLAAEIGFRLAKHARSEKGEVSSHASTIQGAVLGLLALLLGFTFSLSMSRFEARKDVWRDEANSIGTTYLRAQLLPEPMGTRIQALLRSYTETRLELAEHGFEPERLSDVNARSTALHKQMWQQLVAASHASGADSELVSLFTDSLNETIDFHATRVATIRHRVPAAIFVLLFVVAIVSLGLTGYASGPNHLHSFALNALVAVLITLVTLVTFDLHRPTRGFITLDKTGLLELRNSMR